MSAYTGGITARIAPIVKYVLPTAGLRMAPVDVSDMPATTPGVWLLAGCTDPNGNVEYIELSKFPFRVGRKAEMSLSIPRATVSGAHAEFIERDGTLYLRDLNSTNGTYINGKPVVGEGTLMVSDLIQFADVAFRLSRTATEPAAHTLNSINDACDRALTLAQFDRLMGERAVIPYFQPIVTLPDRKTTGYEILGRSKLYGMQTPKDMFLAASQLNLESELSAMIRLAGVELGANLPHQCSLYVNTHPTEIVTCGLLDSLAELREKFPQQQVVLEVHEAAATSVSIMKQLREALTSIDMKLAYDDFGAGQSRLVELATVSPDIVKFDMKLIRDIDQAPMRQQQMLATLVRMVREMGITTLAEGVETEGEHHVIVDVGFEMAQGYLYGKPNSVAATTTDLQAGRILV